MLKWFGHDEFDQLYYLNNYIILTSPALIIVELVYVYHTLCKLPSDTLVLTRGSRTTHIGVSKLGQHWLRWWLVATSAPIVNETIGNNPLWTLNKVQSTSIQENKRSSEKNRGNLVLADLC